MGKSNKQNCVPRVRWSGNMVLGLKYRPPANKDSVHLQNLGCVLLDRLMNTI
jgi:hypothetical protein